jgi:AcrR family transcriptional regulator
MSMTDVLPVRKDARRNRKAILIAARELLAESGDVPMVEIGRRAGVGQATLYRNFPDREALVAALFGEDLGSLEVLAAEYQGDPDAFFVLLRSIVECQVRLHGLKDGLRERPGDPVGLDSLRKRFITMMKEPLRDAKAAGYLRRDLTVNDVMLVVEMIEGTLDKSSNGSSAAAAARALTLVVDGLAKPVST